MIVSLQGILVAATPLSAIIETHGIGYEVHVPISTAERMPAVGQDVKMHIVAIYREDSQALYGFASSEERDFFRLLIEHVSGVGPKMAITVMSRLSLPVLRSAILSGDVALLSKCHGIGKKTAERLVVELKDRVGPSMGVASSSSGAMIGAASVSTDAASLDNSARRMHDAILALTALGYKVADAEKSVRKITSSTSGDLSTEELVKRALSS